jgi:CheY-like chemotaxis protein
MGQAQQKHRAVLIVEDDAELRHLTAALFEDEKVDTIECESAEAALAVMLIGGREVAMIFADVRLPGAMGGVDLAWEVKLRWPLLPMILTSGHPLERIRELPPGVAYTVAAAQRSDCHRTGASISGVMCGVSRPARITLTSCAFRKSYPGRSGPSARRMNSPKEIVNLWGGGSAAVEVNAGQSTGK